MCSVFIWKKNCLKGRTLLSDSTAGTLILCAHLASPGASEGGLPLNTVELQWSAVTYSSPYILCAHLASPGASESGLPLNTVELQWPAYQWARLIYASTTPCCSQQWLYLYWGCGLNNRSVCSSTLLRNKVLATLKSV